ncbi:MAG TPA: hypothetical protein VHG72_05760 [Polyangia bacterium]|nr:hypothetical protein [Polyangia bacterium]
MNDPTSSSFRNKARALCAALALAAAGCGGAAAADVAYEDAYAGDYYYPADVAYSGVYAADDWDYGIDFATITSVLPDAAVVDAGLTHDAGFTRDAAATSDAAVLADGGVTSTAATSARGAVGEAIRKIARGGPICPGQATITKPTGTPVCGSSGTGLNIVFNNCQLSAGGTITSGTVNVALTRAASDTNCNAATTIALGYTETITGLTYTGTGGAKIVLPNQTSTSTINYTFGQKSPATIGIMSMGEIQRFDTSGNMTTDRTYNGTQTFSAISLANESYTVDGTQNVTDKAGGNGTTTATGLMRELSCCKPVGGSLAVSRMSGSHNGSHTWTFMSTCGSATLDGKTVTLPACL